MVNLVANLDSGKRPVPELIQDDFTAGRIVQELEPLLADGVARAEMMAGLKLVATKLHGGRAADETAIGAVASIVLERLGLAG
jgi:lipid A disaccharide synthetase